MNILLVYPSYPDTFFSFKHALRFISKRAAVPPLGLITVAGMLPLSWKVRLVDLNVASLKDEELEWADYLFMSAMYIQKESVREILDRCQNHKLSIVAGGPLVTHEHEQYPEIDHFILNEAEITLPPFIKAVENGDKPDRFFSTNEFADLAESPIPRYELLEFKQYASLNIQISRGCPFNCDFCEIPAYLGHAVRMKEPEQIIRELDTMNDLKWRGNVSIVDDNFIGNKREIKEKLLPAMISWMKAHRYPFIFNIQTSIDIAEDDELLTLMIQAGINSTFIGIETPAENSLMEANKVQNKHVDMLRAVKKIQHKGMQVSGGFIIGFDSDTTAVFKQQIDFIQEGGIVWAMVGLLNAPKNTALYERLEAEGRITAEATGSNTDYSMNFIPKMDKETLLWGYRSVIENIYAPKPYYQRIRNLISNYKQEIKRPVRIERHYLLAFFKSIYYIGIIEKGRAEFWKFLGWILTHRPTLFLDAMMYTISGYHFRKVYRI